VIREEKQITVGLLQITEVSAERDLELAMRLMREVG
jgi:hypothetical protein